MAKLDSARMEQICAALAFTLGCDPAERGFGRTGD
jgi:hypothetical protein